MMEQQRRNCMKSGCDNRELYMCPTENCGTRICTQCFEKYESAQKENHPVVLSPLMQYGTSDDTTNNNGQENCSPPVIDVIDDVDCALPDEEDECDSFCLFSADEYNFPGEGDGDGTSDCEDGEDVQVMNEVDDNESIDVPANEDIDLDIEEAEDEEMFQRQVESSHADEQHFSSNDWAEFDDGEEDETPPTGICLDENDEEASFIPESYDFLDEGPAECMCLDDFDQNLPTIPEDDLLDTGRSCGAQDAYESDDSEPKTKAHPRFRNIRMRKSAQGRARPRTKKQQVVDNVREFSAGRFDGHHYSELDRFVSSTLLLLLMECLTSCSDYCSSLAGCNS